MPLYLIERSFAERVENDSETVGKIVDRNNETGIHWLYSFLSADKKKTYCLYEATDPEDIREAARRLGIPADEIIEVSSIRPEEYIGEEAAHGASNPFAAKQAR